MHGFRSRIMHITKTTEWKKVSEAISSRRGERLMVGPQTPKMLEQPELHTADTHRCSNL